MKFSQIATLFAITSTVFGQDLSSIPSCALTCFINGASAAGCGATDVVCQCTTGKTALTASVTPCVTAACDTADQAKAESAAIQICAQALSGTSSAASSTSAAKTSSGTIVNPSPSTNNNVTLATGAVTTTNAAVAGSSAELLAAGAGILAALLL